MGPRNTAVGGRGKQPVVGRGRVQAVKARIPVSVLNYCIWLTSPPNTLIKYL